MSESLPPEDQPPAEWRRLVSEAEAQGAVPEPSLADPVSVGMMFCEALDDPGHYRTALLRLTTPESHAAWGDFSAAAEGLRAMPNVGFGSMVNEAVGAPDVVYFKVLSDVVESYQVLDEQPVSLASIVTLVWRPERGQWLVHAMGGSYVKPDDVPRTAA